jgi:hypothetical protein
MRAFPKRWRVIHADEFLATAAQLSEGLGSIRFVLTLANTVFAGMDVRRRTRPPLRHWLAYRLWNQPVPVAWHGWMRDDLSSPLIGPKMMTVAVAPMVVLGIVQAGAGQFTQSILIFALLYVAMITIGTPYKNRQVRRHVSRKAGWGPDGWRSVPTPWPRPGDQRR